MGHFVIGIIAKESDAENIAADIPFKFFHRLNQGYVIFPLNDTLLDKHILESQEFKLNKFIYLSDKLMELLSAASTDRYITYIETDYFGGHGLQAAVVIQNARIVYGPKKSDTGRKISGVGPISEALKIIGVIKDPGDHDEFESIGLCGLRSSDELLGDD